MEANKYLEAFGKPFNSDSVKWKTQYLTKDKTRGFAVPYADSRAIADRLDEVVGQMKWQDSYTSWHTITETDREGATTVTESQLCTISVYFEETETWISKTDGASNSDVEPVKGGLSDAFKRAASKWNIGRYLYRFNGVWVEVEQQGRSYVIKDTEKAKLETHYNNTIAKLFPNQSPALAAENGNKGVERTNSSASPQEKPDNPNNPVQARPAAGSPPKQTETSNQQAAQQQQFYEVLKVEVNNGSSGTSSRLKLKRGDKVITAFLNGENDRIKQGTNLKDLILQERSSNFGKYHVIEKYDIAA